MRVIDETGAPKRFMFRPSKRDLLTVEFAREKLAAEKRALKACGDATLSINARNRRTMLQDARRRPRRSFDKSFDKFDGPPHMAAVQAAAAARRDPPAPTP